MLCCILCSNSLSSQVTYSVLLRDHTESSTAKPFFDKIKQHFSPNSVEFALPCKKIEEPRFLKMYEGSDRAKEEIPIYLSDNHSTSRYFFVFSIADLENSDRKQLKAEVWFKDQNPRDWTQKTVIADLDIFLEETDSAMQFISRQIKHTLSGLPKKRALYVSRISEMDDCGIYYNAFSYFIQNKTLNESFYVLRYWCKNPGNQAGSKPQIIACFRRNAELEFKYFESGIIPPKTGAPIKLNCDANNNDETKLEQYCRKIISL